VLGSQIRAKFWNTSTTSEPGWQLSVVDTAVTASTEIMLLTALLSATNVLPFVFHLDNFEVINPQRFTVTRSADGHDKALAAGEQVRLWSPARYAL